jgi:hypothetical protein
MLSDAEHIARLRKGRQMIHRLRSWEDGDTLYGVRAYNAKRDYNASSGKTFQDRASAESQFKREPVFGPAEDFDVILFEATVRSPTRDPVDPGDPGEPPSKYARLEDITILNRKRPELD